MARGRSSVGDEMEHVCASCRGRRAPATGRPTPDYRATNSAKLARSSKPFAASRVSAGGERARRVVDRRVVAPCVARPSARDGLAEASLSRATSEPSAAHRARKRSRRGAAPRGGRRTLAVDARVSCRRWGRGAVRGGAR